MPSPRQSPLSTSIPAQPGQGQRAPQTIGARRASTYHPFSTIVDAAMLTAIILAVIFLAYANGANDNFKGVATLFGSGTARYRTALVWATVTTLAGSLLA